MLHLLMTHLPSILEKGSSLVVGGDATEGCSGVCDSQSHGEGLLAALVHFMKLFGAKTGLCNG